VLLGVLKSLHVLVTLSGRIVELVFHRKLQIYWDGVYSARRWPLILELTPRVLLPYAVAEPAAATATAAKN